MENFEQSKDGTPPALASQEKKTGKSALVEIAALISGEESAVLQSVTSCAENPQGWFESHREQYSQRCVMSSEDTDLVQWLGLVDILEEHGWVCERDWKDELEDFSYFVQNLRSFSALNLELDPDWFDEDEDIPAWCGILTDKWAAQGVRMAAIGIDSDSYVLFPVTSSQFETLQKLAGQIGHCIDYAEQM